jgi:YGGT family
VSEQDSFIIRTGILFNKEQLKGALDMSYQPYPPEPDAPRYRQSINDAPTEAQRSPVYDASHAASSSGSEGQSQYQSYVDPAGNRVVQHEESYVDENLRRANIRSRITSITYFILGVLEVLLLLRLLLRLLGANEASGFVTFLYDLTHIFVGPFNGIFNDQALGRSVFETSTLIAMIIYALLAWGIVSLGRLVFAPTNPASQNVITTRRDRL